MEEITLDLLNMQHVSNAIPFFQNPPAMLAVSVVVATILCIVVVITRPRKYNWIIRMVFWLFVIITALMLLWLIGFALYH